MMCDEVFFDVYLSYLMSKSAGKLISHYAEALSYTSVEFYGVSIHRTNVHLFNVCTLYVNCSAITYSSSYGVTYRKTFIEIKFILQNHAHNISSYQLHIKMMSTSFVLDFSSSEITQQKKFTPATRREKIALKSAVHSQFKR